MRRASDAVQDPSSRDNLVGSPVAAKYTALRKGPIRAILNSPRRGSNPVSATNSLKRQHSASQQLNAIPRQALCRVLSPERPQVKAATTAALEPLNCKVTRNTKDGCQGAVGGLHVAELMGGRAWKLQLLGNLLQLLASKAFSIFWAGRWRQHELQAEKLKGRDLRCGELATDPTTTRGPRGICTTPKL